MNQTLLIVLSVVAILILFWALAPGPKPSLSSLEAQGWDVYTSYSMVILTINTKVQGFSTIFTSHADYKNVTTLTEPSLPSFPTPLWQPFISHTSAKIIAPLQLPSLTQTVREISKPFISHIDAFFSFGLEALTIETVANPRNAVFVSHYDAALRVSFRTPTR